MQTLTKVVVTLGGLLLPCLAAAQAPNYAVSGPALGLVADRASGAIRPILGTAGAATWGAPLAVDFATVQTAVAPGGDYALVVARDGFRVATVRAAGGAVQWLALAGTDSAPDLVAFSPRGRAAALYYQASRRLVVLSGLRDGAAQAAEVDTTSLPAAPSLLAVSEDASSLLVAIAEGDSTALYFLPAAQATPRPRLSPSVCGRSAFHAGRCPGRCTGAAIDRVRSGFGDRVRRRKPGCAHRRHRRERGVPDARCEWRGEHDSARLATGWVGTAGVDQGAG